MRMGAAGRQGNRGAAGQRRGLRIAALYALFAVVSTLANLGAQRAVLAVARGLDLPETLGFVGALLAGTGAGFVVKYLLDRRWIFDADPLAAAEEAKRVGKYGLTAIATTLIFWSTEAAFWLAYGTDAARELGAVIGLAMGYALKYWLDRRYVFRRGDPA